MRTHGEMVDPGDEFNRNPMFFCGKCSTIHGTLLSYCDGLRGGYLSFKPSPAHVMSIEQADRRPDGMPTSKYERDLRRIVGAQSGIKGLYTDDGEMQGEEDGINIDFMRDEVDSINRKLLELGISRMKKQPAMNPWQQAVDDEMVALHLGVAWGDPKTCLKALLDWHVSVALDPSVSSDAAALVDRGRAEAKTRVATLEALVSELDRESRQNWSMYVEVSADARALQAKLDRLMFEYCPEDMTAEQVETWEKHQRMNRSLETLKKVNQG